LPVITSVFAGVADYLHDGVDGFVLQDPHDVETLSRLIQLLYSDADIRTRIGSAAAHIALEWKWDRNAEAVWRILKDLSVRRKAARV
jgi:glycosyltransferase involved in cell wall biosynthesis